jgi:hypothetical protein
MHPLLRTLWKDQPPSFIRTAPLMIGLAKRLELWLASTFIFRIMFIRSLHRENECKIIDPGVSNLM